MDQLFVYMWQFLRKMRVSRAGAQKFLKARLLQSISVGSQYHMAKGDLKRGSTAIHVSEAREVYIDCNGRFLNLFNEKDSITSLSSLTYHLTTLQLERKFPNTKPKSSLLQIKLIVFYFYPPHHPVSRANN